MVATIEYDRLDELAQAKFGNINMLAQKIGISSTAIYTWKKRGIGFKQLQLLRAAGINPDYIKYGTEPMLLNGYETEQKTFQAMEPQPVYMGSFADIIRKYDLHNITINQMPDLKQAMIEKIRDINRYLKAANVK